jgi:6-phosphogluconolactonase (cycloisomerase 2 family)
MGVPNRLDQIRGIAENPTRWFHRTAWWVNLFLLVILLLTGAAISLRHRTNLHPNARQPQVALVEEHRFVYVADYSGNSILAYTVDPSSGMLRPVPSNPFKAEEHPYSLSLLSNTYLYAANRGRSDEACGHGCSISAYAIDLVSGGLVQLDASPFSAGKGSLTVLVHPSGKFVYCINLVSGDLQGYSRSEDGVLKPLGYPMLLGRHPINASFSPSGQFLYVSNQDDANISAFRLDSEGVLGVVPGSPFATGLRPRSITIDPSGRRLYVLNYGVQSYQGRNQACVGEWAGITKRGCNISAFSIDQETGALSQLPGSPFESDGINPHGSAIDSTGKFLFVANINSNDVSVFAINSVTGALNPVKGSPFPAGEGPNSLALDYSDSFLYVLNGFSRDIYQFAVEEDGRLTNVGKPVPAGLGPVAIVAVRKSDH